MSNSTFLHLPGKISNGAPEEGGGGAARLKKILRDWQEDHLIRMPLGKGGASAFKERDSRTRPSTRRTPSSRTRDVYHIKDRWWFANSSRYQRRELGSTNSKRGERPGVERILRRVEKRGDRSPGEHSRGGGKEELSGEFDRATVRKCESVGEKTPCRRETSASRGGRGMT